MKVGMVEKVNKCVYCGKPIKANTLYFTIVDVLHPDKFCSDDCWIAFIEGKKTAVIGELEVVKAKLEK